MKILYITTLLILLPACLLAQTNQEYFVEFNSGEKRSANSVIYKTPAFGKSYFKIDDQKISASEITHFKNEDGEFLKKSYNGIQEFYKIEDKGKINLYSKMVTTYSAPIMGPNGVPMGSGMSLQKANYYSMNNSDYLNNLHYKNLIRDLKDNQESMNYLKDVKKMRTANALFYTAGAAMIIGGIIHTFSDTDQPGDTESPSGPSFSPLFIGGGVLMAIPLFKGKKQNEKLMQAVKAYNN